MIYASENNFFFSSSARNEKPVINLKHGDIVSAKIVSLHSDGKARIFFNGSVFEGTVLGNLKDGTLLKMQVVIQGEKIFLVPLEEQTETGFVKQSNFFTELGLPQGELSSAILSFLMASESGLTGNSASKIFSFLRNTKNDKKKAAFSAGLLENKGIELKEEIFKKVYSALFGEDSKDFEDGNFEKKAGDEQHTVTVKAELKNCSEDAKDKEDQNAIFELLNHKRSGSLHWLVLPFEKKLGTVQTTGTLAVLLDLNLKTCRRIAVHCNTENEKWIFILKEKHLRFKCENISFSEKEIKVMEELFSACFEKNGLLGITVTYGIIEDEILSVNLKV